MTDVFHIMKVWVRVTGGRINYFRSPCRHKPPVGIDLICDSIQIRYVTVVRMIDIFYIM